MAVFLFTERDVDILTFQAYTPGIHLPHPIARTIWLPSNRKKCTLSLSSIQPGGVGHISSVKVRLLHAAVRKRILHLHSENPDYYDLENFGVPVNDLDSIVTILSFSASLIWISLPRLGIFLRNQE